MSNSLNEMRQHISSIYKTSQITNAMQMVSSSKLAKLKSMSQIFFLYSKEIQQIFSDLISYVDLDQIENIDSKNYLGLIRRNSKYTNNKTVYIIISSNNGLVGDYNTTILKEMNSILGTCNQPHNQTIISIGKVGTNFFKNRGFNIIHEYDDLCDNLQPKKIYEIRDIVIDLYQKKIIDQAKICYNRSISTLSRKFYSNTIVPIMSSKIEKTNNQQKEHLFEPSKEKILENFLPLYVGNQIYSSLIYAKIAEHTSRMISMKKATDNAKNSIDELKLFYNQKRQGAITQEINEMMGGSISIE